jgi:hypothetical protein
VWYSSKIGLFSARQHLCLSENFWDAENSAATERYYIVDAVSGEVTRRALSMQAYTDDQYRKLLRELGFRDVEFYPALSGQKVEENSQFVVIVSRNLKYQILSLLRIVWPEGFVGENRLRDWISRIVRTWARLPAVPSAARRCAGSEVLSPIRGQAP